MNRTAKKLAWSIALVVLLSVCLAATTLALALASVDLPDNRFTTGTVRISLNGGAPIVTEDEFLFEPGMRVEKPFYIENLGTSDVWYRLYFANVSGTLADVLDVAVTDEDGNVLYSGKMTDLVRDETHLPAVTDAALPTGEKRTLKLRLEYPAAATSETAGAFLQFDLVADAVQVQNNEEKNFE